MTTPEYSSNTTPEFTFNPVDLDTSELASIVIQNKINYILDEVRSRIQSQQFAHVRGTAVLIDMEEPSSLVTYRAFEEIFKHLNETKPKGFLDCGFKESSPKIGAYFRFDVASFKKEKKNNE